MKRPRPETKLSAPGPMIPIDRGPILREWRQRCEEAEAALRTFAAELESFHAEAAPAYSLWLSRNFGGELTAVRELTDALREAETIAAAIRAEVEASRVNDRQAYQIVMKRKKNGEELFPRSFFTEDDGDWDEGWSEVDPFTEYGKESDATQSADSSDEGGDDEKHSSHSTDHDAAGASPRSESSRSKPVAPDPESLRLKSLYRRLAFLLHPDANPRLSERERQIWNLVQTAYRALDADALELLLLRVESTNSDWLAGVEHVATLISVWTGKMKELRLARVEVNRLHRDPAWRFWSTRHSAESRLRLHAETEATWVKEFLRLQARLRVLEARFQRLAGR